ncbi:MAG TPA: ATP-binding protein [Acidimicrobiia bacterium]|nr:ATP-binding protein [Acidimicrobiia bacterium]
MSERTGPGDDALAEQMASYRSSRERIERGTLPLATSVDGVSFEFQASLHDLTIERGCYVMLEGDAGGRLGQVTEIASHSARVDMPGSVGTASSIVVRIASGSGLVLEDIGTTFHDARVRLATSQEVEATFGPMSDDRAGLTIGELFHAPGVPAVLDSGGLNRHTFMCGQSGSGKTYSLGLLLERVLAETTLRIVILDPNSDYVGLGSIRPGADPETAEQYRDVPDQVTVWGNDDRADQGLRLRFAELDTEVQAAILGLDPIRDREEYAVLADLLRRNTDGQPLITGLDQLTESDSPSARQLGLRAANLGILEWDVWAGDRPSILQELDSPTARCTVIDLGSLSSLEEQRLVAQAVLSKLWTLRQSRQPCLLVIDEAHNICAADPQEPVSVLSTDRTVQIAAEGRKFGLYLLVSTQSPHKVPENVVSQCDNVLLMRLNSQADVEDLTSLFSFVPPGLVAGLSSFRMGQALVGGKIFPLSGYVRMGARTSEEGGADIPIEWAQTRPH